MKLDLSIDEKGMSWLEKLSFDAYNESDVLAGAIERYRKRTGHYPERALADKKTEYIDNVDRIEVERSFSLAKRCYGLGRIMTKPDVTTRSFITLSILVMNVSRIAACSLRHFLMAVFSRYLRQNFVPFYDQKGANELLV